MPCIVRRLLPPLYPRTHEVLGWIQGTRYAIKNEKIDVLEILDTLETLKILIIKPKPRVRQADRIDQRQCRY